jgi:hypothetical protein
MTQISRDRLPQREGRGFLRFRRSRNCFLGAASVFLKTIYCGGALVGYRSKTSGGPLTRLPLMSTVISTRLAIQMKGMPLFIP